MGYVTRFWESHADDGCVLVSWKRFRQTSGSRSGGVRKCPHSLGELRAAGKTLKGRQDAYPTIIAACITVSGHCGGELPACPSVPLSLFGPFRESADPSSLNLCPFDFPQFGICSLGARESDDRVAGSSEGRRVALYLGGKVSTAAPPDPEGMLRLAPLAQHDMGI